MSLLSGIFLLVMGAVFQAVLPASHWLGEAPLPILPGLVLFYALTRRLRAALLMAMLAGFLQDAMCMIPLGYSSFLFCLAAWLVNRVREEVYIWHWTTHLLFGALLNAGVNLGLYLLLALNDLIGMRLFMLALRVLGSALLGGVFVPLVFRVAQALETRLGVMEKRAVA